MVLDFTKQPQSPSIDKSVDLALNLVGSGFKFCKKDLNDLKEHKCFSTCIFEMTAN